MTVKYALSYVMTCDTDSVSDSYTSNYIYLVDCVVSQHDILHTHT